ncbi:response regulator [Hymenobacter negativus]|uniref:Response regulator transcription factor n=1 Tax=Hymenobacter negativus TaxID=2795026 RepID=A0ABS3QEC2_9BACT|nr:response regulator transcription factor [Hymenobacter negativus]MBO2009363.1 response regulator transcription factor [Hymenobacter negativus]
MLAIAIIEDQAAIRESLAEYLDAQPEFRCVLAAESVERFLACIGDVNPSPRLVLSDIGLPGGRSGIEGLPLIRQRLPQAEVVMLSVFVDAERVFEALRAGAVGYLEKSTMPEQVKEALLQVAAGGSPMSPAVARHVVRYFQPRRPDEELLSPREQQIVRAIEDGLSYKLIAAKLGISVETVRNHIRHVYAKLQVNSKLEALAELRRRGR